MKKLMTGMIVVVATAGMASAAGLEVVSGTIRNEPNQEIVIIATGPGEVSGVSLQVQLGDGGEAVGGTDLPGVDAPPITGVNFRDNADGASMWADAGAAAELPNLGSDGGAPLLAFPVFVLAGANVTRPAPGRVASLIVDGSNLLGKTFDVLLEIPAAQVQSNFNGVPADALVPGVIEVIPEPATALLLLGAVPFLRRRRA